jgi:hypothetical protein
MEWKKKRYAYASERDPNRSETRLMDRRRKGTWWSQFRQAKRSTFCSRSSLGYRMLLLPCHAKKEQSR